MTPNALLGRRVVELGLLIAAPACCQLLADFGAKVIKVEPATGDGSHQVASNPFGSIYTRTFNTGKRSQVLNLRDNTDRSTFATMLDGGGALVMNLAPGSMKLLGLLWPQLKARQPHLIVTIVSGYGAENARVCTDMVAQCECGFAALDADADGTPRVSTSWPTNPLSGMCAGIATTMAILDPDRVEAMHIDVSMMEVGVAGLLGPAGLTAAEGGEPPPPSGNRGRSAAASNIYRTRHGWAYISAGLDHHWRKLAPLVGGPDLSFAERVASGVELDRLVEAWTTGQSTCEVLAKMWELAIPAGAIRQPAEAVAMISVMRPGAAFQRLPTGEAVPSFPAARLKGSPAPTLGGPARGTATAGKPARAKKV